MADAIIAAVEEGRSGRLHDRFVVASSREAPYLDQHERH